MKRFVVIKLLLAFSFTSPAQVSQKKTTGWLYGSIGWHRVWYTNSTIHFRNDQQQKYNFKIYRAKAIDDNEMNVGKGIDAPQWSLRFGGIFNKKRSWGLEWSYEHAKYILKQGQRVRLKGTINGHFYDQDTIINRNFIEYEHTDGANYYMLSFLLRKNLRKKADTKHAADLLFKIGAGPVVPRTDSKIMGNHYNDHYHLAGYVAGVETSFRFGLLKNILAELSFKGAYASYSDVLLYGGGRASQDWLSGQILMTGAYQFPMKQKVK